MSGVPRGCRRAAVRALLAVAALLLGAAAGAADPYEHALAALERGEFDSAIPALEAIAEGGDVRAQAALASVYLQGIGVAADVPRAMWWNCRVAQDPAGGRPVMHAVWLLAEYFRTGGGVPGRHYLDGSLERADPVRAYFWFSVMASQASLYADSHPDSVMLGKMGMSATGRELYDEEKTALARALAAWRPGRPVLSAETCLSLPSGLPGE